MKENISHLKFTSMSKSKFLFGIFLCSRWCTIVRNRAVLSLFKHSKQEMPVKKILSLSLSVKFSSPSSKHESKIALMSDVFIHLVQPFSTFNSWFKYLFGKWWTSAFFHELFDTGKTNIFFGFISLFTRRFGLVPWTFSIQKNVLTVGLNSPRTLAGLVHSSRRLLTFFKIKSRVSIRLRPPIECPERKNVSPPILKKVPFVNLGLTYFFLIYIADFCII